MNESFVDIAGCRTFVQRGGSGPTLLWLHGAGGGGRWTPALARLAEGFDVVAPELPGFGRSDTPDWFDNIHDVGFFVLDLLKALDLSGVHMVGTSLGGWVAAEAAVRSTERLASVTLVGPAGLHMKGVARPDTFLWTDEEATRALFHDQALADAMLAVVPDDAEQDRRLKNKFATARLAWSPRWHDPHLQKWLHRIDVPTLIAWGGEDRYLPPVYAAHWAGLIPGAQAVVLPGIGHAVPSEAPAAFCALVEDFCRRIER
jgi:pimeloyl-ACP methyl ester carboxylesterase